MVGTKKDKLVAYRKIALLEEYMERMNDYQKSYRLASVEANRLAEEQFASLRGQLAQIKSYKVDGYVCISKGTREVPTTFPVFLIPHLLPHRPLRCRCVYVYNRNSADLFYR